LEIEVDVSSQVSLLKTGDAKAVYRLLIPLTFSVELSEKQDFASTGSFS